MAEGIAKQLVAEHLNVPVSELPSKGYNILSAGTFGMDGAPVSPESVQAMKEQGVDISDYSSSALTEEMIQQADAIFCMTESHRQSVVNFDPSSASKTFRLDPDADVPDPIGLGLQAYQKTADMIRTGLLQRLKELTQ